VKVLVPITNKLNNCSANRGYMFECDDVELVLFGELRG
jgi:hypothetical protein